MLLELVVPEDDTCQFFSVQFAVFIYQVPAEDIAYLCEGGHSRQDEFACNNIGVDNGYAPFSEQLTDGRLATAYSTCERNSKHDLSLKNLQPGPVNVITPDEGNHTRNCQVWAKRNRNIPVVTDDDHHGDTDDGTDQR